MEHSHGLVKVKGVQVHRKKTRECRADDSRLRSPVIEKIYISCPPYSSMRPDSQATFPVKQQLVSYKKNTILTGKYAKSSAMRRKQPRHNMRWITSLRQSRDTPTFR